MEKLQEFEMKISDMEKDGVFAISLVDRPAIEEDFIYLSKEEIHLKVVNEEKRIVCGLALVPDKRIYRRVNDKEFNIFFTKDTINQANQLFMERLNLNNVTIDHEKQVQGVSVVESWIVEDSKMDKSNLYNLNAVVGSWVVMMKVNNDEVWNDIKLGKYKGFSIEAMFSCLSEYLSKQEKNSNDELIEQIKELLSKI